MLSSPATLLATTALINFGLALFVYSENRASPVNIWFALFTLFLSAWSVSVLAFLTVGEEPAAVWSLKFAYASAALIAGSYYCFSLYFGSNDVPSRMHIAAASVLSAVLALLLLMPGFLTGPVANRPEGREIVLGCLIT